MKGKLLPALLTLILGFLSMNLHGQCNTPTNVRLVAYGPDFITIDWDNTTAGTFQYRYVIQGGSLVTAEHAHHYGRDVFTVPGRLSDSQSKGCLNLIRKDKARMITSAADLAYWMGWESKSFTQNIQKQLDVIPNLL